MARSYIPSLTEQAFRCHASMGSSDNELHYLPVDVAFAPIRGNPPVLSHIGSRVEIFALDQLGLCRQIGLESKRRGTVGFAQYCENLSSNTECLVTVTVDGFSNTGQCRAHFPETVEHSCLRCGFPPVFVSHSVLARPSG